MSAIGGILAAVEDKVRELLATDSRVSQLQSDVKALSARVAALEASGGTSTPPPARKTAQQSASVRAGAATAKGKAADTK